MNKAEEVVAAFAKQFPECKDYSTRPSVDAVEEFMRPFAPISYEVQRRVFYLFRAIGLDSISTGFQSWWEANFVVSGSGPLHARRIDFLVGDPCTFVLPHLPAAIEHAKGDVDPRLIELLDAWNNCGRDAHKFHELMDK